MRTKMEKFKILAEFIKDASSETKDVQTFLFVKDYISKYQLTIDITSKPKKNELIEISTTLKFGDKENNEKKSYFEIVYVSIIKLDKSVKEKKDVEKIILCDVQKAVQPKMEKAFTDLINNSGFKQVTIKNIDFEKLYNSKFN
jgi:preprotein translocase subunit SecB